VPSAKAAIIKNAMIDADIVFIKASLYRVSSLPAGGPNISTNHDDVNFRNQDLIIIDILYSFSFKFFLNPIINLSYGERGSWRA
jgi:hypothetical protein